MTNLLIFLSVITFFLSSINIENPWIRPANKEMNTGGFMDISNTSNYADTLYKAECDFAELVQIHESYQNNGMMGMREIKELVIPPKSTVSLKPRSYHIMFIGLTKDLKDGTTEKVKLYFKKAGIKTLTIPITKK